jgi:hypothetical protein
VLRYVHPLAYPQLLDETQLLWYKELATHGVRASRGSDRVRGRSTRLPGRVCYSGGCPAT